MYIILQIYSRVQIRFKFDQGPSSVTQNWDSKGRYTFFEGLEMGCLVILVLKYGYMPPHQKNCSIS